MLRRRNIIALFGFVLFYIFFGVILTVNQEALVYHPSPQDFNNCPALADAVITTENGTRFYHHVSSTTPTVVVYHGNAGSACDRAFFAELISQVGYGYLLVEYTGYSNDTTPPSHDAVKENVRDVIRFIRRTELSEVYVLGESIGTGAAAYHSSLQPPETLILIAPFTDLAAIAAERFWFYPTRPFVNNAFNNVKLLSDYRNRIGIIHGDEDEIISHELGRQLFESLSADKAFVTISGAGHNNLFTFPETYTTLTNFLQTE